MKYKLVVGITVLLSACVPAEPVVSDFNGDSVKIQVTQFASAKEARANSQAEANRICGRVGRRAEYASTLELSDDFISEHLYLCL